MRTLIAITLLSASPFCFAEELYVVFEQADFLGGYSDSIYLSGNKGLRLRREGMQQEIPTAKGTMPTWKIINLSDEQISEYVDRVIQIGVKDWKEKYPESTEGLICDGLTFQLLIEIKGLKIKSFGSCYTPDSYEEFVRITTELFKD